MKSKINKLIIKLTEDDDGQLSKDIEKTIKKELVKKTKPKPRPLNG